MSKLKSQASLEYLSMFGIVMILVLLLGSIYYNYTISEKDSLRQQQVRNIGNMITKTIQQIYYLGNGNKLTISLTFPSGIKNMSIVRFNVTDNNTKQNIIVDYLNITYIYKGHIISDLFHPKDLKIHFNCSLNCTQMPLTTNNTWISYYNQSWMFSPGTKNIEFVANNNYVDVNFVD